MSTGSHAVQNRWRTSLLTALALATLQAGCRPASYEILRPGKDRSGEKHDKPTNVAPDKTGKPNQGATDSAPPTARVEVVFQDQSVTRVYVNSPVLIRPSADTVDADDVGKSSCSNPGIIKANYSIGTEARPAAARKAGCETLGTPYTFTKAGDYKIDMVVTSNENETAVASMTLRVIDRASPLTENGGFTIHAVPLLAKVGQNVDFSSYCRTTNAHSVAWNYGDASTAGAGDKTRHAYAAEGQYRVNATCAESIDGGQTWTATVTVVVVDKEIVIPGLPTRPAPPDSGRGAGFPGQNPNQGQPGQQ